MFGTIYGVDFSGAKLAGRNIRLVTKAWCIREVWKDRGRAE